jgi:DNA (cytosine-5)-methyltransferase 1
LALFAGAGGGILGGHLLGWKTVCAVEYAEYPAAVLIQRQNEGILPNFPIWDDVRTFDGRPWKGVVEVVSGGFPCQDISIAGKGEGITGERSGLWSEMCRIIGEVQPRYTLIENSPALISRGLERVLCDLASMGYDAKWGIVGAHHAGAPHKRDRIWILGTNTNSIDGNSSGYEGCEVFEQEQAEEVANTKRERLERLGTETGEPEKSESWYTGSYWWGIDPADLSDSSSERFQDRTTKESEQEREANKSERLHNNIPDTRNNGTLQRIEQLRESEPALQRGEDIRRGAPEYESRKRWGIKSGVGRVANGVPHRIHKIKAIGNAQVPSVVKLAFTILNQEVKTGR